MLLKDRSTMLRLWIAAISIIVTVFLLALLTHSSVAKSSRPPAVVRATEPRDQASVVHNDDDDVALAVTAPQGVSQAIEHRFRLKDRRPATR